MRTEKRWTGSIHIAADALAFSGQAGDTVPHAHLACQLVAVRHGTITIVSDTDVVSNSVIVVPARCRHQLLASCQEVGIFYPGVGPGLDLALNQKLGAERVQPAPPLICDIWYRIWEQHVPLSQWAQRFAEVVPADQIPQRLDPRVTRALHNALSEGGPGAIGRAASTVGLSPAGLRLLVRRQTGASLTQWVRWFRLERAAHAMRQGDGLAAAAVSAGFADQSHYTRTMKAFFGITPGAVQSVLSDGSLAAE